MSPRHLGERCVGAPVEEDEMGDIQSAPVDGISIYEPFWESKGETFMAS
jgi:hypothetical protein